MNKGTNNTVCKAHSGLIERIKDCEDNVKALWKKWDNMQIMVLGIFITLCLNLAGGIFILVR